MFNTVAGLYTLWQLRQREQGIDRKEGEGMAESKKVQRYGATMQKCQLFSCGILEGLQLTHGRGRERTATNIQLVSDLCDLTVPSTALGFVNLDDGIVGLAGTVSSLIGVWSVWKKTA